MIWPFKRKAEEPETVPCARNCGRVFETDLDMRMHLVDYWRTAAGTKPMSVFGYTKNAKGKWVPDTYDGPFRKVPGDVIW